MAKSSASSSPCSAAACAQMLEILERAEFRMDRVVAALRRADRVGAAGIVRRRASACCCGPCGSCARSGGSAGNTARRSPCRGCAAGGAPRRGRCRAGVGSSLIERGNTSYQLANPAAVRSACSGIGRAQLDPERPVVRLRHQRGRLRRQQRLAQRVLGLLAASARRSAPVCSLRLRARGRRGRPGPRPPAISSAVGHAGGVLLRQLVDEGGPDVASRPRSCSG